MENVDDEEEDDEDIVRERSFREMIGEVVLDDVAVGESHAEDFNETLPSSSSSIYATCGR